MCIRDRRYAHVYNIAYCITIYSAISVSYPHLNAHEVHNGAILVVASAHIIPVGGCPQLLKDRPLQMCIRDSCNSLLIVKFKSKNLPPQLLSGGGSFLGSDSHGLAALFGDLLQDHSQTGNGSQPSTQELGAQNGQSGRCV